MGFLIDSENSDFSPFLWRHKNPFMLKPEIFKQNPSEFKNKIILLKPIENLSFYKQPCET
jgi:hypothetical protein